MARILLPLAEGFEELEAVTIIDLLRRAEFGVVVAGLRPGAVKGGHGIVLHPDMELDDALRADYDMMVLPGGLAGTDGLDADARIHRQLQRMAEEQSYIAAICAAPRVLANAGVLRGKRATAYPGVLEPLARDKGIELSPHPVVRDGTVITSRGPGTAMDFALVLIEILGGRSLRNSVEDPLQRPL